MGRNVRKQKFPIPSIRKADEIIAGIQHYPKTASNSTEQLQQKTRKKPHRRLLGSGSAGVLNFLMNGMYKSNWREMVWNEKFKKEIPNGVRGMRRKT